MKLKEIMTSPVISIHPEETVAVAARLLQQYNIGVLPVCDEAGALRGLVTDRDLVTRCVAAGRSAEKTRVSEVMTSSVVAAGPEMDAGAAAYLMGRQQIRRLPVMEQGKLRGMVTLGDLANREETGYDAADALGEICCNVSKRI